MRFGMVRHMESSYIRSLLFIYDIYVYEVVLYLCGAIRAEHTIYDILIVCGRNVV